MSQVSSRVAAVVALVPPTDLRVAVWDAPETLPAYRNFPALNLSIEKAAECSPLLHVSPDDAPALVIMGGQDKLVPEKHGHWIDDAYGKEDVQRKLIVLQDAGHGLQGDGNRDRLFREVVAWFGEHLKRESKLSGRFPPTAQRGDSMAMRHSDQVVAASLPSDLIAKTAFIDSP